MRAVDLRSPDSGPALGFSGGGDGVGGADVVAFVGRADALVGGTDAFLGETDVAGGLEVCRRFGGVLSLREWRGVVAESGGGADLPMVVPCSGDAGAAPRGRGSIR